jgi:hypothetical protein
VGRSEEVFHRVRGPLARGTALLDVEDGVALGEVLRGEGEGGDERLEDALAADRHRRDRVGVPGVEAAVESLRLQHLRQVPLVVLEDEGHLRGIEVVGEEVLRHLPVALEVLLPAIERGVGHEDERVGALEDEPARGRVHGLPGDGEDLKAEVEAAEAGGLQGQEVEEDRPVLGRGDRDELTPVALRRRRVEHLEVGGLPPDRRPVVDDLDLDDAVAMLQLHGRIPKVVAGSLA